MNSDSSIKAVVFGIITVVLVVIGIAMWPLAQVDQTQRGIVLRNGALVGTMDPGLHFRTPLIDHIVKMDVAAVKEEVSATAASKDLQNATTKVAINYQVNPTSVAKLYTEYQNDHASRLIAPAIQESVKAATAKYTAEELVTKREQVKTDITNSLKTTLSPHGINVTEVFITDFGFSASFDASIENKVKAEQDALTAKNKLVQIQYEADQKVATAKAEAESIRLQSEAANNEKYVQLKQIEVQLEMAKHWKGDVPQTVVSGSGSGGANFLSFLNLGAH